MSGVLLPGWNLQGRLPSLSALARDGGFVALGGPIPAQPGQLLRVPKVIYLINGVLPVSRLVNGQVVIDQSEFLRVGTVQDVVAERVTTAMPDAIVRMGTSPFLAPTGYSFNLEILPQNVVPSGVPCLGCDFLDVFVGAGSNGMPADFEVFVAEVVDQLPRFAAYSVRVFGQAGLTPDYFTPLSQMVSRIADRGVDIRMVGETTDATEDSVAQLVADHYGVPI